MSLTQILVLVIMAIVAIGAVWLLFKNEKIKTAVFTILLAIFISANVAFVMGYANAMPESEQHGVFDFNGFDITQIQTYDNITGTTVNWDGSRLQYVYESWRNAFDGAFVRTIDTAGYWSTKIELAANNALELAQDATDQVLVLTGIVEQTQADIVTLTASVDGLTASDTLTQAEIDALTAQYNDLLNATGALNTSIGTLDAEKQAQIDALNLSLATYASVDDFNLLMSNYNTLQTQADAIGVDLANLDTATQAQIDALQTELDALTASGGGAVTLADLDAMGAVFSSWTFYTNGDGSIGSVGSAVNKTFSQYITFLRGEMWELFTHINGLQDEIEANALLIADLQAQIDAITGA